jgi:flagellar hook-length control protein FliK
MVSSITPFQFKINNQVTASVLKTDDKSENTQNGKTQNVLKPTQDETFKHILSATDKNQSDPAKSNNKGTETGTQNKTENDVNVNGTGNIQAFAASTTQSSDHSQAQSVVRQTSNAISQAVNTNRSNFNVHLSPQDLGGITVKMVSKNGTMSIQIIADNPHTGQLLSSSIADLNSAIGQHGITVGKSEILNTGSNSSSNNNSNSNNSNFLSTGDFSGHRQQSGQQQTQQQPQQLKQSESAAAWNTQTQAADKQVKIVIPQVLARSYDMTA